MRSDSPATRQLLARSGVLLAALCLSCVRPAAAAEQAPATQKSAQLPKLDDAVARGLDYLARQQNADGSFSVGKNADGTSGTVSAPPVAGTGLALMAFLS